MGQWGITIGLALAVSLAACGGDDEQTRADAAVSVDASTIDAPDSVDASGNVADADPNAPDADPNAPDADTSAPDADTTAADASTAPDASVGIACGGEICDLGTQECCVTRQGMTTTATCVATGTCGGSTASCDGPEDCAPAEDCCATVSGPGMGGGETSCTDSCGGFVLCNDSGDCPTMSPNCCANPFGDGNVCTQFACL
jgi:hypothetical protein